MLCHDSYLGQFYVLSWNWCCYTYLSSTPLLPLYFKNCLTLSSWPGTFLFSNNSSVECISFFIMVYSEKVCFKDVLDFGVASPKFGLINLIYWKILVHVKTSRTRNIYKDLLFIFYHSFYWNLFDIISKINLTYITVFKPKAEGG